MQLQVGLDYIRPEDMESFLNNSCLTFHAPETALNAEMEKHHSGPYYEHPNFTISANFMFLCPNSEQLEKKSVMNMGAHDG